MYDPLLDMSPEACGARIAEGIKEIVAGTATWFHNAISLEVIAQSQYDTLCRVAAMINERPDSVTVKPWIKGTQVGWDVSGTARQIAIFHGHPDPGEIATDYINYGTFDTTPKETP